MVAQMVETIRIKRLDTRDQTHVPTFGTDTHNNSSTKQRQYTENLTHHRGRDAL